MPAPTFVKSLLPLITPLRVPEPAPPIELLVFKEIALLSVELVPLNVSAPALLMPVPFKVIALVLPSVALLKLISSAAPLATVILLLLFNALLAAKLKVPAFTVVAPLYKLAPDKIKLPLPALIKAPVVLVLAPEIVKSLVVSIVLVVPVVKVKLRFVDVVAPVYCKVPPPNTKFTAALDEAPILLLTAPLANVVATSVPALIVVAPV